MIPVDLLWGIISAYVTLHLIALGHSIFEKSGLLNLAIDGVFFFSTGVAVFVACSTGSPLAGSLVSAIVAAGIGLLLAYIMTVLPVSHGAVGLSMMFIGYGLGIIFGYPVRMVVGSVAAYAYPVNAETYLTLFAVTIITSTVLHFILKETKLGMMIVACGENPAVATALGVDVLRTRLLAAATGFALIGYGSSLFPLLWQRYWDIRSYTLGFGWLAFTVALVAGRHSLVLIPISLLFGGLYHSCMLLTATLKIPVDVAKSVPFVAALIAMVIYSKTRIGRTLLPPTSLGKVFYKEERAV